MGKNGIIIPLLDIPVVAKKIYNGKGKVFWPKVQKAIYRTPL
jgi:hypothetical protein